MIEHGKFTNNSSNKTVICGKKIMNLSTPVVMGIVNLTDDSFYDGGKYNCLESAKRRIEEIVCQKADTIDLGACSTRPGAELVPVEEEIRRLIPAIRFIKSEFPDVPISIDTVWSEVCIAAINEGRISLICSK